MFGFATKGELAQIEENVKQSFSAVREDTQNLRQWVDYLASQQQRLQHSVDENVAVLERVPTKEQLHAEVTRAVASSGAFEQLMERVRHMEHRVDSLARVDQKVQVLEDAQKDWFLRLRELHSQVENLGNVRRQTLIPRERPETVPGLSALQEKMVRITARNSKDAIKQSILKLIRMHGKISGVALRESIVSEQGLCSKSSFYRLLEEIEETDDITVVDEGKEKVYLWGGIRAKKARKED